MRIIFLHLAISIIYAHGMEAQETETPNKKLIINLALYRSQLIADNADNYKEIVGLDTLWKMDESQREMLAEVLFNVIYAHELYGTSPKQIMKKWEKHDLPLLDILSEKNIGIIVKNKHLVDLLTNDILKPDPPFQIDPKTWIFEELEKYEIKNGMRIAEIGAGTGIFSLLLGMAYDSLQIYMNDIDYFALEYAAAKIETCKSRNPGNKYHAVLGKKKTTNLETVKMDKIIIRNSFHHFDKKDEMLASIKQSMTSESDLYIYDPILEAGKDFGCNEVMGKKSIRDTIHQSGFEIIDEINHEDWGWVLFKCKIKG